jgi:hypothetical protein
MLKKAIIFLPLGKLVDKKGGYGCLYLSDSTRLHINNLIYHIKDQSGAEDLFPKKTIVFSNDLPAGVEALEHFQASLDSSIATRMIEGLAFDFHRSNHDKRILKREVEKVWTELKKATETEGFELVIMIGDNTFSLATTYLQNTGIGNFIEFSKKGSFVPCMTDDTCTDNSIKSRRKKTDGYVPTIVPHRAYYTINDRTIVIDTDDEIAAGNLYTGHAVGEEDKKLYWLKNGLNLHNEKFDIIHMKV